MTTLLPESSTAPGALATEEAPSVLHSGHYHASLLRTLFEVDRIDAGALLSRTAEELACVALREQLGAGDDAERVLRASGEHFRKSGLGRLDLAGLGADGGEAVVSSSHSALAWLARYGEARRPVCAVAAGYIAGALAAATGRRFEVKETECVAGGAGTCRFRAAPLEGAPAAVECHSGPVASLHSPVEPVEPGWDELLASAFPGWSAADPEGRIRGPGGTLSSLWGDFYARLAWRFEEEVPRAMGAKFANLPGLLLAEAAQLHAFHFLGSVLQAEEWTAAVEPRLGSREDRVHALVALLNRMGWGAWRVHALLPEQRLVVRIYDSYEAVGYRRHFGSAESPRCHLARGVAAALMNLVYRGDPSTLALTVSEYNRLFRSPSSFRAVETRCRAQDDPFCEVVANPLSPTRIG